MASTIVGLDIGSNSARAVEVQGATSAKPVIVKFHEVPLPAGSVRRGEVIEGGAVSEALKRLWSDGGFSGKAVALGIGGQRVFARDLAVPRASQAQIRESLPLHVQELLPVPVTEAVLDFYPISEENTDDGPMVNGLLIAAIKEAVKANVDAVAMAGLRPVHVDLIPFALTRALAPVGSSSGLSVLLGIGANTTNVVVAKDGVPQFVRIISGGGDDITRALSSGLQLSGTEADALKRELGMGSVDSAPQNRPALEIIRSAVGELLDSIRNTLNYYSATKQNGGSATRQNGAIDRIIVSGGATHLSGFNEALASLTGLPVSRAVALGGTQLSRGVRSNSTAEQQDAMSTAFGLALGTAA